MAKNKLSSEEKWMSLNLCSRQLNVLESLIDGEWSNSPRSYFVRSRLSTYGYVELEFKDSQTFYRITKAGRNALSEQKQRLNDD